MLPPESVMGWPWADATPAMKTIKCSNPEKTTAFMRSTISDSPICLPKYDPISFFPRYVNPLHQTHRTHLLDLQAQPGNGCDLLDLQAQPVSLARGAYLRKRSALEPELQKSAQGYVPAALTRGRQRWGCPRWDVRPHLAALEVPLQHSISSGDMGMCAQLLVRKALCLPLFKDTQKEMR